LLETNLKKFKLIALIEGISFITLLFIAMPIKYMLGYPVVVKIVGMAHGGLFILYIYFLYEAAKEYKWSIKFIIFSFILSLIPFGTFYLEKKLNELDKEL
jgi:integral membrane protein